MTITTTDALNAFCGSLASEPFVTLDTEFIRENTYWPQLCLVQIAGSQAAEIIDPLADGIDLSSLYALLENPDILKVLHSGRQDIEIFFERTGKIPAPLFDTQIAAMVCGYGESVSYEQLVMEELGRAIDKSQRFTDWAARPLSNNQLEYALSDVTHLREVYQALNQRIEEKGRSQWIAEEMAALIDPEYYQHPPEKAWKKVKCKHKSPKLMAYLGEVAAWREREAQKRNVPRKRVIKDDTLVEVARIAPKTPEQLMKIRGLGSHMSNVQIQSLLDALATAAAISPQDYPLVKKSKRTPPGVEPLAELLKVLLKLICEQSDVASKIVADKDDLRAIAMGNPEGRDIPALTGWRYDLFGKQAERLLSGRVTLRVDTENGGVLLEDIG